MSTTQPELPAKVSILICGSGITGLSSAYALREAGFKDFLVLSDSLYPAQSWLCPGLLSASPSDSITRFAHSWGLEQALELQAFQTQAFNQLVTLCQGQDQTQFRPLERIRIADTALEKKELEAAELLYRRAGFTTQWDRSKHGDALNLGLSAALIDPLGLKKALLKDLGPHMINGSLNSLNLTNQGIKVHTSKSSTACELLVLANHLSIKDFLPEFTEVMISYIDSWQQSQWGQAEDLCSPSPSYFSWQFGGFWGTSTPRSEGLVGGLRFLRKHAGIGAKTLTANPKVKEALRARALMFGATDQAIWPKTHSLLECQPCDELPVIGPMYGNARILLASGFNRDGLVLGFGAGYALASLILCGTEPKLPRLLWPERLRSLYS